MEIGRLCLIFLVLHIILICVNGRNLCDSNDWVAYKDEKCFKLFTKWALRDEAENICIQQSLQTDNFLPKLVEIKTAEEKNFLNHFIYDISGVEVGLWIGAKRNSDYDFDCDLNVTSIEKNEIFTTQETGKSCKFSWNDGSCVDYSNWDVGRPTDEIKNACVKMKSAYSGKTAKSFNLNQDTKNGKWTDVTCAEVNYFVCEKLQPWSVAQLQKTLLDVRRHFEDFSEDIKNQLSATRILLENTMNELELTKNELQNSHAQLVNLQRNPVPIGYIYIQYPNQALPNEIWPSTGWSDVSSQYDGVFFRANGGSSSSFGSVQDENSPRLTNILSRIDDGYRAFDINVPPGSWSPRITLGAWAGDNVQSQFLVSGGEVRPRNMAVRIWKRIN